MKIAAGLKAAAKAFTAGSKAAPEAESFRAGGKRIVCAHCENILFKRQNASLNTAFSSIAGTEWCDPEACILICANCSRIEWFNGDVESESSD